VQYNIIREAQFFSCISSSSSSSSANVANILPIIGPSISIFECFVKVCAIDETRPIYPVRVTSSCIVVGEVCSKHVT
jgi:hypothetical protein